MVGLQGAGTTTWVTRHLAGSHALVSKDHWPRARRREARQRRLVTGLLAARRSVVVDDTNPSEEDRVPLVGVLATGARFRPPTRGEGFDRVDVVRSRG